MGALFSNVVRFGRLLHDLGLDVPVGRSLDVAAALEWVDVGRRDDVYHTLRTLLVRRARDLPLFDEAFEVFWRPGDRGRTTLDLQALGERRKFGVPEVVAPAADARSDGSTEGTVNLQQVASASASEREVLRTKDFGALTHDELHAVSRMIRELVWAPGRRVTRRWKAGAGAALDLRRLLRSNLRHGEVPVLPTRRRRQRDRPLVLICDVSGSMERYTRMLLQFVCGVSASRDKVETFVFATRLSRLTPLLRTRRIEDLLANLARRVPDLGGGTRTGQALRAFHRHWARRLRVRSAVVLMISDGWDRGDPGELREGMARLHRSCHRLIWLNPLLGSDRYRPATRGMRAALPYVDDFLPVHNLTSLEALAAHLDSLSSRRTPTYDPGTHRVSHDVRRG